MIHIYFLVLRANTDRGRKHKVSIGKRTTLCNFVYKKTKHPPETYSQILRQLLNLMYSNHRYMCYDVEQEKIYSIPNNKGNT